MNFDYSEKVMDLIGKLNSFMDENIYPNEAAYAEHFKTTEDKWKAAPIMSELKSKARDAGLWNLFLPDSKNGAD
jgi:Acyl-CoA dehydrogenases